MARQVQIHTAERAPPNILVDPFREALRVIQFKSPGDGWKSFVPVTRTAVNIGFEPGELEAKPQTDLDILLGTVTCQLIESALK